MCFIDIHGHSTQKNVFVYGPDYSINTKEYELCRLLPKLMENHCLGFRYGSCSFRLDECKINTARGYFLKQLKTMAYTLESSYGLYDDEREVKQMRIDDFLQCGAGIVAALAQYLGVGLEESVGTSAASPILTSDKVRQKLLKSLKSSLALTEQAVYAYRMAREHNSDSEDDEEDLTPKERSKI